MNCRGGSNDFQVKDGLSVKDVRHAALISMRLNSFSPTRSFRGTCAGMFRWTSHVEPRKKGSPADNLFAQSNPVKFRLLSFNQDQLGSLCI